MVPAQCVGRNAESRLTVPMSNQKSNVACDLANYHHANALPPSPPRPLSRRIEKAIWQPRPVQPPVWAIPFRDAHNKDAAQFLVSLESSSRHTHSSRWSFNVHACLHRHCFFDAGRTNRRQPLGGLFMSSASAQGSRLTPAIAEARDARTTSGGRAHDVPRMGSRIVEHLDPAGPSRSRDHRRLSRLRARAARRRDTSWHRPSPRP